MMEESISSAATIPPMINKPLLASKLNAYQVEADKSGVPINLGFGLRMLEQINQHMPTIAIKGLKEINIPISSDDSQVLKHMSKLVNKGVWEMALNSNSFDTTSPSFSQYLSKSIPMMTDLALRHLKLSREKVLGMKVQPNKLIIMEPGHSLLIKSAGIQQGVFATMIVQLPVQGGHEDGLLKIFRGNQARSFRNSLESSKLFHYTVFLSDCSCQMQKLSSGSRVALIFDLVCSNPSTLFPPMPAMVDVTQILQQLKPNGGDRLLAIPLNKDELSFTSLSTRSNRLVDLFLSLEFLDIRLAVVGRYRVGKANPRTGCECCRKHGCPCQKIVMQEGSQERIQTMKWIDTSNEEIKYDQLHIDTKTEIVSDEPVFFENPTDEKIDIQTWVLQQWYYRPLLVVWHKERSVELDCLHRFGSLLDNLNRSVDSPKEKEEFRPKLNKVVTFCCEHPEVLKKGQNSSCRLLKLCLQANAKNETLQLLKIIADQEGIKNAGIVNTLSQVVKVFGWKECATTISLFVSLNHAQEQMREFVGLVLSLLDGICDQGALEMANRIFTMLCTSNLIETLEISVLALCVDMLIQLDRKPQTSDPNRLESLANRIKEKLSTFQPLLELLACVQHCLDARSADHITDSAIKWYCNLCLHLASLDIPPETPPERVLSAVKLYVSSGDDTLLEAFIRQLTSPRNQENNILKSLLKMENLWKLATLSTENKQVVYSLVDRRIQWLIAIPNPKSTWAYPKAIVVGHPVVEEFMRSDEQSMVYANFNNLQHARNWARKHFTRCADLHSIAEAEANGAGKRAYCLITKHKKCYDSENLKYAICHQELMRLIDLRLKRLGDAPCTVVVNSQTKQIFSVVVQPNMITPADPIQTPVPNTTVDVKPVLTAVNSQRILSIVQPSVKKSRGANIKLNTSPKPSTAPSSSSVPSVQQPVSNVIVIKNTPVNTAPTQGPCASQEPTKVASKILNTAVLVGPTNVPSNTTPKRPGVVKRPLTAYSPFRSSPVAPNQVKTEVITVPNEATGSQRHPLTVVQRTVVDPSPAVNSSPSKRLKLDYPSKS